MGTRCSLSRLGAALPAPHASSPAPGARQVPVAAVTVSMETGPAQQHPGDRGRGGRGVCPPPHGDTPPSGVRSAPGGA